MKKNRGSLISFTDGVHTFTETNKGDKFMFHRNDSGNVEGKEAVAYNMYKFYLITKSPQGKIADLLKRYSRSAVYKICSRDDELRKKISCIPTRDINFVLSPDGRLMKLYLKNGIVKDSGNKKKIIKRA